MTLKEQEQRLAYWLIGPPVVLILSIIIVPVLWNFWLSVKSITLGQLSAGAIFSLDHLTLENFNKLLVAGDSRGRFYEDLVTTVLYSFLGVLSSLLFGLFSALLLNRTFRGRGLLRGLYLFPYVAPIVAVAYVGWRGLMNPTFGLVSRGLQAIGIFQEPVGLLIEEPYALTSIILFQTWRYGPFCMLFILARLQSIPSTLYEAAQIDGATPFQQFFLVTLPKLRGILATLFLLRFLWVFNKFDDVYLLTEGAGGTEILPIYLYKLFIGQQNLGMGAALSVLLFAILGLFLFVYFGYVLEEW